jgi:anti-sigma factor RsiW
MSDRSFNPELDDELLSAYLDDELSADERAAVEARLADDPAARELLHQLRAVSQSVQGLPEESVGRDLREPILKRITSASASAAEFTRRGEPNLTHTEPRSAKFSAASNGTPSLLEGDPVPRISIGRSRRSWIWASLAVAAALLIMFVQSRDEIQTGLPHVAQHTDEVSRKVAQAESSDRAATDESLTAAPASEAAGLPAPAESAQPPSAVTSDESSTFGGQLGAAREVGKAGAPMAAASRPTASKSGLRDEFRSESVVGGEAVAAKAAQGQIADLSERQKRARQMNRSTPEGLALESESNGQPDETKEVVVRVVAKRAALDNKLIDQLLVKNGIAVDAEQVADDKSESPARGLAEDAKQASAADQVAQQPAQTFDAGCDVVVVDAPHEAIRSCVSDLNRDLANYTYVEVDDASGALGATKDKQLPAQVVLNNQAAEDLRQYNRGTLPEQQKEFLARNQQYYFQQLNEEGRAAGVSELSYGVERGHDDVALKKQVEMKDQLKQNIANQGRAFRVYNAYNSNLQNRFSDGQSTRNSPTNGALFSGKYQKQTALPDAKAASALTDENLRVWFFICPEEPTTTSTPAKNPTE